MAIPRQLTYDPRTSKINSGPVDEMMQLRTEVLGALGAATAPCTLPVSSACELEVSFARPTAVATLAVRVEGGSFHLDYVPNSDTVNVSFVNNTGQAVLGATSISRSADGVPFPTDELTMLPTDNMITMRIFLDADLAEVCESAPPTVCGPGRS
jgi:hypothetical protein